VYLASDASAILPHTNKLLFIEDGWLVTIDKDQWHVSQADTNTPIKAQPEEISWQAHATQLGDFKHFMIKEINDQPSVLRQLADTASEKIAPLVDSIQPAFGTFMIGCGTASYAALSGTYLFSRIAKHHVNFAAGSEFFYQEHYLTPDSLVIAISQSGETMDIIESVQLAKKHQSKVAAITNSQGSSLYRMADLSVLLDAGVEKAVCSTKAFTAMVGVLLLAAYGLNNNIQQGASLINQAANDIEAMLMPDRLAQIQKVANYIQNHQHLFVIGRGLSYAASLEAALKIKEVSYIHAEGFAGGELKHGVIALIESGTPCLVFAPKDETEAAIISNAMELKARGGYIIGVSPTQHSVFDSWIQTADVGDASIITSVVPAQLLGYFLALAKGYDPDKPRNLAKSVTVK
jgi:glucosamine--fructose-6-phosphate aminotransferase (isomerizing)